MRTLTVPLLFLAAFALSASGFHQRHQASNRVSRSSISIVAKSSNGPSAMPPQDRSSERPFRSARFAGGENADEATTQEVVFWSFPGMIRSRLRTATGFSFTIFRATLRSLTGISLTAIYAGALAASGLWIRKTMSALLGVFPSGFRYFLQPFLVMYYTPLIILRSLASPTNRKRAVAKHETIVAAWKEAVVVAEKTERDGYWPVVVNEDGYFELTKPPSVDGLEIPDDDAKLAEAMATTVEQAMELKSDGDSVEEDDPKSDKD
eukprot:CAMPEP_0197179108 /NCGR_PEP_ID=MMETSP1423-20130617/4168_1 /TAXON_ID=476441 /ORGANISM="Pseudo-nitzschia heimii, Strain UNC1101" /LENGTH=263 /DNA_ID=CAMNT_0042628971 /DNA_START=126 /DNA_END=917 /DNA_ORIENTATION=-